MRCYTFDDLLERRIVKNRMGPRRWAQTLGFPPAIKLGPNTVVWDADAVDLWCRERAAASLKAAADTTGEAEHAAA